MTASIFLPKNLSAFLDMLAASEGTSTIPGSDDGYNVINGGTLFHSYADHPRIMVSLHKLGIQSSAAGRYQLLGRYFDHYKTLLHLPDFGPESQDAIAVQQIKEQRALDEIEAGTVEAAIALCSNIWASLPGAGYGQHENKMDALVKAYTAAGGTVA